MNSVTSPSATFLVTLQDWLWIGHFLAPARSNNNCGNEEGGTALDEKRSADFERERAFLSAALFLARALLRPTKRKGAGRGEGLSASGAVSNVRRATAAAAG